MLFISVTGALIWSEQLGAARPRNAAPPRRSQRAPIRVLDRQGWLIGETAWKIRYWSALRDLEMIRARHAEAIDERRRVRFAEMIHAETLPSSDGYAVIGDDLDDLVARAYAYADAQGDLPRGVSAGEKS